MNRPSTQDIKDACQELQDKWPVLKKKFEAYFPDYEARLGTVFRSPEDQNKAFKTGSSKMDGYKKIGKHNRYPSEAIDVNLYHRATGAWADTMVLNKKITRNEYTGLYAVLGLLAEIDGLRWGNDWDGDQFPVGPDPDEQFVDVYHLETKKEGPR